MPLTSEGPRTPIIDSDVHAQPASVAVLAPYLDSHWREYVARSDFDGPSEADHPPGAPTTGAAACERSALLEPVFAHDDVECAVVNCAYAIESVRNPYAARAMASAVNDWQIAEWLDPEPRLRASIVVPSAQPELAVGEIERVGEHPGFVQVLLPVRSTVPYGNLRYHPLHEAAARHGLAVALHFGGATGLPPTTAGWPSYFIEEYVGMASAAQVQLTSLVCEGVFARIPELRIVLAEVGFAWLPQWMWRADKDWQMLGREVPWVSERPSDCVREHVRLTTAPLDGPAGAEAMTELVARDPVGFEDLLLYSTDHPHRHDADADDELLSGLSTSVREKILARNARSVYGL